MRKGNPEEVYKNLVRHYNRSHSPEKVCHCGKIVTEGTYERHLNSKSHQYLMYYKEKAEKNETTEKQEQIKEKPKYKTTWDKVTISVPIST